LEIRGIGNFWLIAQIELRLVFQVRYRSRPFKQREFFPSAGFGFARKITPA
jgi:hypothetical protein